MGSFKRFKQATVKYVQEHVGNLGFELNTLQDQLDREWKTAEQEKVDTDPLVAKKREEAQMFIFDRKAKHAGKAIQELQALIPKIKATRAHKKDVGEELTAKLASTEFTLKPAPPDATPKDEEQALTDEEREQALKNALKEQAEKDADVLKETAETQPWDRSMSEDFRKRLAKVTFDKKSGTVELQNRVFSKKVTVGGETYSDPEYLASGSFGAVVKYTSANGKTVAVKAVTFDPYGKNEDLETEIRNNNFLAEGSKDAPGRENVLLMKGLVKDEEKKLAYIVMDCAAGDLNDSKHAMNALSETGALPEEARSVLNQHMMKQAVQGMQFVRDQNMVHYDLKEGNVMIMPDGTVKIADFGTNQVVKGGAEVNSYGGGTKEYQAPEVQNQRYGKFTAPDDPTKSDTYSLGRMLDSLHTGNDAPKLDPDGTSVGANPDLTGALGNVNEAMTKDKAPERPTLEAVLDSSYFRNLENYNPETIKELMAATVAYGNSLKGKKVNDKGFTELSKELHVARAKVQDIEKKLKDADEEGKPPLKIEWQTARTQQVQLEADLRTLANDKTVKPHLDKVRELSQRLQSGG
jgi:serine/threonine protein kinase